MGGNKRGFTLIELIIVIAVMGLLISIIGIGIPAYNRYLDKSRLKEETKAILLEILEARNNAILDGHNRKVLIFRDTGRIYIQKLTSTNPITEKRIQVSNHNKILYNTYLGNSHLVLISIGTVSMGGHITLGSPLGEYMTIVVQIGTGRIYMKEGLMYD